MIPEDAHVVELTDGQAELLHQHRAIKGQIGELQERADAIRELIEDALHDPSREADCVVGTIDGEEVCRSTIVYANRLDTKKLREQYPSVYETFTRLSPSVRFTVPNGGAE